VVWSTRHRLDSRQSRHFHETQHEPTYVRFAQTQLAAINLPNNQESSLLIDNRSIVGAALDSFYLAVCKYPCWVRNTSSNKTQTQLAGIIATPSENRVFASLGDYMVRSTTNTRNFHLKCFEKRDAKVLRLYHFIRVRNPKLAVGIWPCNVQFPSVRDDDRVKGRARHFRNSCAGYILLGIGVAEVGHVLDHLRNVDSDLRQPIEGFLGSEIGLDFYRHAVKCRFWLLLSRAEVESIVSPWKHSAVDRTSQIVVRSCKNTAYLIVRGDHVLFRVTFSGTENLDLDRL
jgi:hypothetical protein